MDKSDSNTKYRGLYQLETERLLLRHWEETDAEELYQYAKDPRVGPIAGWPPHTDVENSRQVIREILSAPETYAVVLKSTEKPVGSVGILFGENAHTPLGKNEVEIGYWIGVPFWGQGLIPEAVEALLHRCFTALHCSAVWCGYYDGNVQSHRVQEKMRLCPSPYSPRASITAGRCPNGTLYTSYKRTVGRTERIS
jgi:RimJ/RimL family protein N-acetyltransferase